LLRSALREAPDAFAGRRGNRCDHEYLLFGVGAG
jgi:hypothetical protein